MALQDELVPKPCEKTAKRPVCNPRKTTFFERFCCLQRLAFDKITFRQENTKRKHHGSEGRKSIKMFPAAAAAAPAAAAATAAAPAPLIPSVQKADGPAPWQ